MNAVWRQIAWDFRNAFHWCVVMPVALLVGLLVFVTSGGWEAGDAE